MANTSVKLTKENAKEIKRHAELPPRPITINKQANIAVQEWLDDNRKLLSKGPIVTRKIGR